MASTIPREPYSRADIERIKADIEEEVDTFRLLATIDRMQEDLDARIERPDTTTNDVDLDALRKVAEAAEKEREATTGIGDVAAWKFIHAFDPPTVLALLDELRDGRAEVECKQCGLCGLFTMVKNPHPDAGKPEVALDVGYVWECVPCTRKAAHGWSQRAIKAAAQVEALRTAGENLAASLMHEHREPQPACALCGFLAAWRKVVEASA